MNPVGQKLVERDTAQKPKTVGKWRGSIVRIDFVHQSKIKLQASALILALGAGLLFVFGTPLIARCIGLTSAFTFAYSFIKRINPKDINLAYSIFATKIQVTGKIQKQTINTPTKNAECLLKLKSTDNILELENERCEYCLTAKLDKCNHIVNIYPANSEAASWKLKVTMDDEQIKLDQDLIRCVIDDSTNNYKQRFLYT